jgi:hypothetical protein
MMGLQERVRDTQRDCRPCGCQPLACAEDAIAALRSRSAILLASSAGHPHV